jgi:hypothetical protein
MMYPLLCGLILALFASLLYIDDRLLAFVHVLLATAIGAFMVAHSLISLR